MSGIFQNPFHSSSKFERKRVHMGITGSVAAYKMCDLCRQFLKLHIDLSATLTEAAARFVAPRLFSALGVGRVYGKMFEDEDDFAHLIPGEVAHCFLVAPATANTLAKLAAGICDDMLGGQFLAFEGPKILAPAMNPRMWANPVTRHNVDVLAQRGCFIIPPAQGTVACGENGQGKLAPLEEIFLATLKALSTQDLAGQKVLVTLGPTREFWDDARFFSNPSSGLMGSALCTAAWLRGAEVFAIHGPNSAIGLPAGINKYGVTTAMEMHRLAMELWPKMDLGIFCAAVADYRPEERHPGKFKKGDTDLPEIKFVRNPDLLLECGQKRAPHQKIIAFAAESVGDKSELTTLAMTKLKRKNADLLAANAINGENGAFGNASSCLAVVDRNGKQEFWPEQSKADTAWELLTWLLKL